MYRRLQSYRNRQTLVKTMERVWRYCEDRKTAWKARHGIFI